MKKPLKNGQRNTLKENQTHTIKGTNGIKELKYNQANRSKLLKKLNL
jgi:hypothetical protein